MSGDFRCLPSACFITRNERKFGCPIIYMGAIHGAILFAETATLAGTINTIRQLPTRIMR